MRSRRPAADVWLGIACKRADEIETEVRQFGVHSIAVVQVHDPAKLSRQLVPSLGIAIVRLQSKRRQGSTRAVMQSGDSVSVKLIQPRNGDEWQSILSRWTQTVMHGSLSEKHAGATGVQGHGECARYYVCTWETCRGPQGMGIESYEEERPKYFGRSRTVP